MFGLVLASLMGWAAAAPAPNAPTAAPAPGPAVVSGAGSANSPSAWVSASSQRAWERARPRLVQVRTLLRQQDSQASVGSGFLVTEQGHLITNYHVVSQFALRPQDHRLVFSTADGRSGALQLLGIDVVHDLALLKIDDAATLAGRGALELRPAAQALNRGERIHALGNPLDVGFAVMEGSFNGLVERSYLPTIFFGGSLSAGMSGGPALDDEGRVLGVNVAARRDGEQVSFLVPAPFAQALLERARNAKPITSPAWPEITRQLQEHQEGLVKRFIAEPWRKAGHERYAIPVPQENFMRCWGNSSAPEAKGLRFERSDCAMDSRVYVSGSLQTGRITVRHETYDGSRIGALRFAQTHSRSFRNEFFGVANRNHTAPQCHEAYVDASGLPTRSLLCIRALKKLPGLYDMSFLVATHDQAEHGAQGRIDAWGLSFDNVQRLAAHYLAAWGLHQVPASAGGKP
jgi:serine protease Do